MFNCNTFQFVGENIPNSFVNDLGMQDLRYSISLESWEEGYLSGCIISQIPFLIISPTMLSILSSTCIAFISEFVLYFSSIKYFAMFWKVTSVSFPAPRDWTLCMNHISFPIVLWFNDYGKIALFYVISFIFLVKLEMLWI